MGKDLGSFSDIQAAMAAVKDVYIDPTTGATLKSSGKSVLEKSGIELSKSQNEKVIKIVENTKTKQKESKNLCEAYRNMVGYSTESSQEPKYSEVDEQGNLKVGQVVNEDSYMASLVAKCNKRR